MTSKVQSERLALDGGEAVRDSENPLPSVFPRDIQAESRAQITAVLENGFTSDTIGEFESKFALMHGSRQAIALSNCTAAIHTVIAALGIGPDDEVVVSPITDYGSVAGIISQGARAVFPDVDVRTGNVTAETIASVITERTRAIIAVHFYGLLCDMDPIVALARDRKITLIEDVCQAPFAIYKGRMAGTIGDIGCFSLDAEKHLSTDHGGVVITDDEELAAQIRHFGQRRGVVPLEGFGRAHDVVGFNNRFGRLEAAVGLGQLEVIERQIERRRMLAKSLSRKIANIDGISPPFIPTGSDHVYWLYHIHIDLDRFRATADEIANAMTAEGLNCGTARYYLIPAGLLFAPEYLKVAEGLSNARKHLDSMIRWQWTEKYTDGDVRDIASIITKVAAAYGN